MIDKSFNDAREGTRALADGRPSTLTLNEAQPPGGRKNLSKSATRALDVLEYFALMGRPLRAVQIAEALELRTSSTDQLLKTLVDAAYLMFDHQQKLYYPSPRLVNFGAWLASNYFGDNRIYRLLQAVHQDTGDIVTLSIRYGISMQIVDFIEPPARAGTIVKGARVSITESIIGTAFLASHSDKEVIRVVEQVSAETGHKSSVAELRELLDRVRRARKDGYVALPAEGAGPWAMAVSLPQPASGMKMVLGLGGQSQTDQHQLAGLLPDIRQHIERWLGG